MTDDLLQLARSAGFITGTQDLIDGTSSLRFVRSPVDDCTVVVGNLIRLVEQRTIERCAAEAERTYIKSATLFELGTAAAAAIRALGAK